MGKVFDAFKDAWTGYPTQDNEGYVPDRGGFKAGWFSAIEWVKPHVKKRREAERSARISIQHLRDVLHDILAIQPDDHKGECHCEYCVARHAMAVTSGWKVK